VEVDCYAVSRFKVVFENKGVDWRRDSGRYLTLKDSKAKSPPDYFNVGETRRKISW
jgi:hypothetical protein